MKRTKAQYTSYICRQHSETYQTLFEKRGNREEYKYNLGDELVQRTHVCGIITMIMIFLPLIISIALLSCYSQ
jgi:hypothetical protein